MIKILVVFNKKCYLLKDCFIIKIFLGSWFLVLMISFFEFCEYWFMYKKIRSGLEGIVISRIILYFKLLKEKKIINIEYEIKW